MNSGKTTNPELFAQVLWCFNEARAMNSGKTALAIDTGVWIGGASMRPEQ